MDDLDRRREAWFEARRIEDARKHRAHKAASSFARENKIIKPVCECLSDKTIQMHHIDYDRPYIVAFMCCRCHSNEHHGNLQRPYRLYDLLEMAIEQRAIA